MPVLRHVGKQSWAVALLGAVALGACDSRPPAGPDSNELASEQPAKPALPVVERPFDRTQLLLAAVRAASSHAKGANDSDAQRSLDGKRFEARLRFGCEGQGPTKEGHGWSVDPDGQTLRLRAVPTLSLQDELVRQVAGAGPEAAEGFWLPRPWVLDASCPNAQPAARSAGEASEQADSDAGEQSGDASAPSAVPVVQRIGLAQFFTTEDSRTRRRIGRPFEAVRQLQGGEQVGRNGFNLVVSGRLRAREDGRVILCAGDGLVRPPDCVISVDVDRVWIERPDDQAVMAEWDV